MSVNGSGRRSRRILFGYARVSAADQNSDHQIDAMFGMLSVLAELQRELIVANTMDGLASARAWPGRRPPAAVDSGSGDVGAAVV